MASDRPKSAGDDEASDSLSALIDSQALRIQTLVIGYCAKGFDAEQKSMLDECLALSEKIRALQRHQAMQRTQFQQDTYLIGQAPQLQQSIRELIRVWYQAWSMAADDVVSAVQLAPRQLHRDPDVTIEVL
jgi:hypothetical protein